MRPALAHRICCTAGVAGERIARSARARAAPPSTRSRSACADASAARAFLDLRRVELGLVDLRALKAQEIESLLPIPRRFETGALRVELLGCGRPGSRLRARPGARPWRRAAARGARSCGATANRADSRSRGVQRRDRSGSQGRRAHRRRRAAPTRRREPLVDDELVGVAQQAAGFEIGLEISGVFGAESSTEVSEVPSRWSFAEARAPASSPRAPSTTTSRSMVAGDVQARLELERGLVHDREPTNPKSLDSSSSLTTPLRRPLDRLRPPTDRHTARRTLTPANPRAPGGAPGRAAGAARKEPLRGHAHEASLG